MSEIQEPQSESAALQELISRLDPESHTLFSEAALGRDAREFVESNVGRYMVGCAQQDYAEAMAKLKKTSPWRRNRMQQLQNEARVAEMFAVYLRDLVIKGKAAEMALEDREDSP